jgi:hypothetical protein
MADSIFKLPPDGPYKPNTTFNDQDNTVDYFVYPFNAGSVTTTTPIAVTQQIQQNTVFEWVKSSCYGLITSPTEPYSDANILPITIQVQDSVSGRNLFYAPLPINTVAGNGKQPYILPTSRFFQAMGTITVTFANISPNTDTYINVYFVMHGVNHWDLTSDSPESGRH